MVGVLIEKMANETNATIVLMGANGTSEKIKPHRLILIEGNQLVKKPCRLQRRNRTHLY